MKVCSGAHLNELRLVKCYSAQKSTGHDESITPLLETHTQHPTIRFFDTTLAEIQSLENSIQS